MLTLVYLIYYKLPVTYRANKTISMRIGNKHLNLVTQVCLWRFSINIFGKMFVIFKKKTLIS